MQDRKIKLLLVLVFGLLIFNCTWALLKVDQSDDGLLTNNLRRLTSVITTVKKFYYKPIDDNTLFTRAISGMLSRLDPHSEYLNEEDFKNLEMMTWGRLTGIGVEVVSDQGLLKVISPIDDTPAHRAGIKSGDYIVQINNKLVRDMSPRDAVNMMRGKKGGLVTLTIIRKNESKPLVFKMRREEIIKTVKEKILESGYGYIRLAAFLDPTEEDMVKAIKRLKKASKKTGLQGVILDLRDNPGGLAESAVQVADDFLDARSLKNNLIVYAKGQNDEEVMSAKATAGDLLYGVPIVVLINSGSASAAEIVAGALQDHKRAIIVGARSFGKGSMQTVIPIDKITAIKLTTALYYTPLGRSIQAKGIEPDINIGENIQLSRSNNEDQDMPRIDESMLDNHIKNADDGKDGDSSEFKSISRRQKQSKAELDLAYKDYQLYEALHILKSQNVTRNNGDE